ncbi:MAG: PAS domain S-box protein [Acidobacteriota bacterium]
MAAAFVLSLLVYLLPWTSAAQRLFYSQALGPFLFSALTVAALARGLTRLQAEERRFWTDVLAAFAAWMMVYFLYLFFPTGERPMALGWVVEMLYLASYVALILAVERHPHRVHRWRPMGLERALAVPAVLAFTLALIAYFVLVPAYVGVSGGKDWSPSYILYLCLDAYLATRFLALARSAGSLRWRQLYLILGLTEAVFFLCDLVELRFYAQGGRPWGTASDLFFYLPYLLLVTSRLRHARFSTDATSSTVEERPEIHFTRPSGRTMIHALAFPLLHYACYRLGIFTDETQRAHETLVFAAVVLLGSVALVQHRLLERKARELWLDRERVETSLRGSEQDLRLMIERYHAERKVQMSEEKFAKALRVSRDIMAISSLTDGRIVDINDSFERLTGFSREEVLGHTAMELGLWGKPQERPRMVEQLEAEGAVRDLPGSFCTKSGEVRRCTFSAERLSIDGEPFLLSVTRVIEEPVDRASDAVDDTADDTATIGLTTDPPAVSPSDDTSTDFPIEV